MDLQLGVFVGVDGHNESKLESRGFSIGFQSITSSDAVTTLFNAVSCALKQGSNSAIRPCRIPYQLLRDVPKHTIAKAYHCRQYTDSR